MPVFLIAAPAFGQAGRAELFGTVQDPSGLPVAGAKVQAEEQNTMARFAGLSDDRGDYHLLGLSRGEYILSVEHPGFRTYKQSGITLRLSDQAALNVKLELGQIELRRTADENGKAAFPRAHVYVRLHLFETDRRCFERVLNTIFTGPIANTGVADSYNRHLERDLSNGDDIVAVSQATNNNSSLGFGTQRPNRVSNPNTLANRSASQWFNTAAFTAGPQFAIGNSSRNPVRGPGLQNADLMIGKTFRVTERLNVEFRAEAFNLTNTPPLSGRSRMRRIHGTLNLL